MHVPPAMHGLARCWRAKCIKAPGLERRQRAYRNDDSSEITPPSVSRAWKRNSGISVYHDRVRAVGNPRDGGASGYRPRSAGQVGHPRVASGSRPSRTYFDALSTGETVEPFQAKAVAANGGAALRCAPVQWLREGVSAEGW
jgi:hypothetical protein